jgi:hypothetical protein
MLLQAGNTGSLPQRSMCNRRGAASGEGRSRVRPVRRGSRPDTRKNLNGAMLQHQATSRVPRDKVGHQRQVRQDWEPEWGPMV